MSKRATPTEKAEQLASIALHVFGAFATDTAEIGESFGLSKDQARTRLATLETMGLVCADMQESEADGGLVDRGGRVGQHNVWQCAFGSTDNLTEAEAVQHVRSELGLTGPSKADVDKAVKQLQAEMSTPEFAAAVAATETAATSGSEEAPVARKHVVTDPTLTANQTKAVQERASRKRTCNAKPITGPVAKTAAEMAPQPMAKASEGDGLRWPKGERHCNKCDTTKPRSEFASNKSSKDGAYHQCKACEAAWRKARAAAQGKAPAKPKAAAPTPAATRPSDLKVSHPRLPGRTFDSSADLNVALDALDQAEAAAAEAPKAEVPASPAPRKAPKSSGNTARTRKAAAAAAARQEALEAADAE
jgi:hypothetical protein